MVMRDGYYGNVNYGLIDSNKAELTGQDIPMPQTALKLGFPPTSGYFFATMRDEALDTLDKIIVIIKKGHLKLSFKTNVFTNGGDIDIQIVKLDTSGLVARRKFSTDGYVEVNFDIEVEVNDRFAIYVQANVGDAFLKFIPSDGYLVEQSAYILNMELIEPFDNIGSLKWSIDPNLERFGSCIRLDLVRPLLKSSYPLLYAKLSGTILLSEDTVDSFTIIDFRLHPYLQAGTSLGLLEQNLPNPEIDSIFNGNNTNQIGAGTAHFGCNNYNDTIVFTGSLLDGGSSVGDTVGWGGEAGAGRGLPTTNITLTINSHSHSISGEVVNELINNTTYSSDQDVRPNTAQMFLYMICDNQL